MTATAHIGGHKVCWDEKLNEYLYQDGGQLVGKEALRDCKKCGKPMNWREPDPCLGILPGVAYACCGHGAEEGYIYFHSGIVIRGEFTEISRTEKPGKGMHDLTPVLKEHQNEQD